MENASKALIIAGAILLAILIISLGILIYNQAASVTQDNGMDTVEMQNFNQQFTQYEGDGVRGSTVRALYQAVLANNVNQDSEDRQVAITGICPMAETDNQLPDDLGDTIVTGSSYDIEIIYGTEAGNSGLVDEIDIQVAS